MSAVTRSSLRVKKSINEAANVLSQEQIAMQVKMELMRQLPDIIKESVKPMEQIEGIKIFQLEGLNGGSANGAAQADGNGNGVGNGNLADQVVNSALRYRSQAPLIHSLLDEVGLNGGDINKLTAGLHAFSSIKSETAKPNDDSSA